MSKQRMSLGEYLEATGITKTDFAALIPCAYSFPGMLINGKARPSFKMACRIEQVTGGVVSRDLWYPPSDPLEDIPVDFTALVLGVSVSVAA